MKINALSVVDLLISHKTDILSMTEIWLGILKQHCRAREGLSVELAAEDKIYLDISKSLFVL